MMSIVVGIISGLFFGFAVKLIDFSNILIDVIIFFVLGLALFLGVKWMSKQIIKVN